MATDEELDRGIQWLGNKLNEPATDEQITTLKEQLAEMEGKLAEAKVRDDSFCGAINNWSQRVIEAEKEKSESEAEGY